MHEEDQQVTEVEVDGVSDPLNAIDDVVSTQDASSADASGDSIDPAASSAAIRPPSPAAPESQEGISSAPSPSLPPSNILSLPSQLYRSCVAYVTAGPLSSLWSTKTVSAIAILSVVLAAAAARILLAFASNGSSPDLTVMGTAMSLHPAEQVGG